MKIDREFASRILKDALSKGADLAEVYLKSTRRLSAEVKDLKVEALESSVDFGYSLRVIRDRRLGFSYSTDPSEARSVVERAIEASRWTEPDIHLDLPGPSCATQIEIFDERVTMIGGEEAIRSALDMERAARDKDGRVTKVRKSSASFSSRDVLIMNSKGVDEGYSATAATARITVVAEGGGDSRMGWDFEGSRRLGDISFERVGVGAAEKAVRMLGARKIGSLKARLVLDSSVAVEFLGIFSSLLSSESVQKGKSLLAGKLSSAVVSPIVSVIDDGRLPRRLGSRPVDDEGVTTSEKYLIKSGVLLGYLYNTYTAKKDGVRSTGNAVRGSFSSLPVVGPSNFCISVAPDHVRPGSLLAEVDKGLLVTEAMGVHTANPISGEFSIGVSGLWVEGGVAAYPVKEAVISGNILDLFGKVEAAGDDTRFYGNMASPSLLIGPTDISA